MADFDQVPPKQAAPDVAVLDHALWQRLETSNDMVDYAAAWLALMCQRISGTSRAVLILKSLQHGQMEPIAYWPKGKAATSGLSMAAETALREGKGVVHAPKSQDGKTGQESIVNVAQPLRADGETIAIVAVEITARSKERLASIMRDLQWGAAWITTAFRNRKSAEEYSSQARLQLAVELFTVVLGSEKYIDACRTLATELASELDCDRVTVMRRRFRRSKAVALSNSAIFDRRTKLIRAVEEASDEAIDQWHTIVNPPVTEDGTVRRAQDKVAALNGGMATLTTPLPVQDAAFGALYLERSVEKPFSGQDVHLVESLSAMVAPALKDKWAKDRALLVKFFLAAKGLLGKLLGPRHLGLKFVTLLVAGLISAMVLVTWPYHVTADARLSGAVQRAVTVPFDGYLDEANATAGDTVTEGDVLARLDTRDLELEKLRRLSERSQSAAEYDRALGEADRVGLNVYRTRMAQVDAQIQLLETRIERAVLAAPFTGVVVTGDLSQRLGDSVERGEVIFEIAPLDEYSVKISVDERDIDQVAVGQTGWLALAAFPELPIEIEVSQILPVSSQADGLNFFMVDAVLVGGLEHEKLRPGMEGVAKITVEDRRLIWIWTHRIVDWSRMAVWRWMY